MTKATVIVDDMQIGTISPRLYGHFAEHLGRCCYGGLWAGRDPAPVGTPLGAPASGLAATTPLGGATTGTVAGYAFPTSDGFRADVLAALRELPVPLIRWPGGCHADHYHWRDGIGDPAARPATLGMSCGIQVRDDNSLGTHEFMRLCELVGAEPYLAGNVGTGSVQELCDWIEYVNGGLRTSLTAERAANGRPTPWAVRLWGIGNESWGCGGRYDPVSYALEYRRYAAMARQVDPHAEFVAVGLKDDGLPGSGVDPEWTVKFLAALGPDIDLVDHLSVHRYWIHGGPEVDFDEAGYYDLLDEAAGTEKLIERTARTLAAAGKPGHRISVALDEWGVWHPEARDWGPGDVVRRSPPTFEQANTLRDAIAAGIALEGFHRQTRNLSMANLAQIVNVLQSVLITDGAACVRTPTYYALALHRAHIGAEALQVEVECGPTFDGGRPALSATASTHGEGMAITLINRDYKEPVVANIKSTDVVSSSRLLSADSANAVNTPAEPKKVVLRDLAVASRSKGWYSATLPPHSMATIEFAERIAGDR